jgi:hypothetical protein
MSSAWGVWTPIPASSFLLDWKALSRQALNLSGHPVLVIVLNDFKLCPRSMGYYKYASIEREMHKFSHLESSSEAALREII